MVGIVSIVGADGYPSTGSDALSPTWRLMKSRFGGLKLLVPTEFGDASPKPCHTFLQSI